MHDALVLLVFALLLQGCGALLARRALREGWSLALARPIPSAMDPVVVARELFACAGAGQLSLRDRTRLGSYHPAQGTVALSRELVATQSLAALAVFVHEIGHASQQRRRPWLLAMNLGLRRAVPGVFALGWLLAAPAALGNAPSEFALSAMVVEFSFILATIVCALETDASRRGLALLARHSSLDPEVFGTLRNLLVAAALSYLILPFSALPIMGTIVSAVGNKGD